MKLWENNDKYTNNISGQIQFPSNTNFVLGADPSGTSASGSYTPMKVYSVRIYNRALTDEETQQNYEIDKQRFNIGKEDLAENNVDLEYIESTGTQYITTSIIPSTNFKIVADVYISSSYSGESCFMGVRDSSTNKGLECYFSGGVPMFWATNGSGTGKLGSSGSKAYNQKIHYEASYTPSGMALETSVNGNESNSFVYNGTNSVTPLMIFAYNNKGSGGYYFRGRIYNIEIYDNDSSASYKLKPVYNKITNSNGLYDEINHKFYINSGKNDFNPGPEINH